MRKGTRFLLLLTEVVFALAACTPSTSPEGQPIPSSTPTILPTETTDISVFEVTTPTAGPTLSQDEMNTLATIVAQGANADSNDLTIPRQETPQPASSNNGLEKETFAQQRNKILEMIKRVQNETQGAINIEYFNIIDSSDGQSKYAITGDTKANEQSCHTMIYTSNMKELYEDALGYKIVKVNTVVNPNGYGFSSEVDQIIENGVATDKAILTINVPGIDVQNETINGQIQNDEKNEFVTYDTEQ